MPKRQAKVEKAATLGSKTVRESSRPSFIDVFAGCGGLSLGLMQAGWRGHFAIERDENAFASLQHNFLLPTSKHKFDWPSWLPQSPHSILDTLTEKREELQTLRGMIDLIAGGPPCQGFSSAGRRNFKDPRNRLVEAYLELVDIVQPKLVLIENVRGMQSDFKESKESGKTVNYAQKIVSHLSRDYDVRSEVLDVSRFGVPQRRQRLLIIASRKELGLSKVDVFQLLEEGRLSFLSSKKIESVPIPSRSALSDLELSRNGTKASEECSGFHELAYVGPLTGYQRLMRDGYEGAPTDTRLARHKPHIRQRFEEIIIACQDQGRLNVSLSKEMKACFRIQKSALRVLDPENVSPTVTSMPDDLIHYSEPRTLTVRENARLQSFPDWFSFKGKYTSGGDRRKLEVPRFTQVANAVPPLLSEAVGVALIQILAVRAANSASSVS